MNINKKAIIAAVLSGFLIIGCSEDGPDKTTQIETPTEQTTITKTAQLIDSALEGVNYTSNKNDNGTTDINGTFTYTSGAKVIFSVGGIEVGNIDDSSIQSDKKVFIQDIVGVERDDTNNSEVLKIARFFQSLDEDNDPSNGIKITQEIKEKLKDENKILKNITIDDVETIITTKTTKQFIPSYQAKLHIDSVISDIGLTPKVVTTVQDDENTTLSDGNIDKKYYGKWVYLHDAQELNIFSTTTLDNFEAVDDNLIKIDKDGTTYSLLRSSVANINISGKVEVMDSSTRGLRDTADIGDIDVILQNILDANIKAEVKTDKNGGFENNTLPTGTYKLTAKDTTKKIEKTVEIKNEDEDLGVFKLTGDGVHNFKAELILDQEFVYGDNTSLYTGKIRVHNISDTIGLGLNYEVNATDEDIKEFTANIASANGSVLPKSYKDIPLNFKFNPIYFNQKTINIDVKIQDVNNNIWKDSFSFEIYKGSIDINIATKSSSIKGYIIMPNTNSIKNIDIENGTISLPLLKDKKYHLVLSNPSLENETAYSIGVNKATEDLTSFSATASYEPNDKESQSNDIAIGESIISYLHFGDLDYWTISTAEDPTTAGESINKIELIEKISIDTRTHTVGTSVAISDNYIVFNSNLYYDENANPTHTTNILAYHYNNTTRNYSKIEDNITVQEITGFSYHDDNLKIKNNIFNVWSETYTISENNILQSGTYPESSQKYSISYDTSGVIVYDNSNETTIQIQKIDVPNTRRASIDGNKFVLTVTDGYKRDSDHAEVYTINETTNEITKIGEIQQHHVEEFKLFGEQVLIKGDYILISNTGASGGSLSGDGVLELFKINNDYNIVHYIQEIRGSQLLNQNNLYEFGISFDLHNNKLIVGSRAENSVYIYNIIE